MRLGIAVNFPHKSPEEWACKHKESGLGAVVFPCDYRADTAVIDAYVKAAAEHDLVIAEVGCWSNPVSPDTEIRNNAVNFCKHQLELAEYVKARCCVNIAGSASKIWDGGYADNYSQENYEKTVATVQKIIDSVNPSNTCYTLEPMPNMFPDSPETYIQIIKDIDRKGFGVHMDAVNMISSPRRYFNNREFVNRCFELLGDKIVSCHLKDCLLEHKLTVSIVETECGKGGFDIPNYLAAIDKASENMPVIIEHLSDIDEYMQAIAYVRNIYG